MQQQWGCHTAFARRQQQPNSTPQQRGLLKRVARTRTAGGIMITSAARRWCVSRHLGRLAAMYRLDAANASTAGSAAYQEC